MKRLLLYIGMLASILILLQSCNSKKGLGKAYHNLTGRYNAYYNAGLRIDEGFETLKDQHRDNYNQLLEMYPYAAVEDASSVSGPLDEAIKKCAKNISLHPTSNWLDDTYLYLGKCEYLKQEYDKSTATFKYIVDKFNPNKPKSAMTEEELEELKAAQRKKKGKKKKKRKKRKKKKRKKKKKKKPTPKTNTDGDEVDEEKPKKYFMKHRPNRHKAILWLAKSYVEIDQHDDAGLYLRMLENDGTVPYRLRGEIQAITAYSFIKRKEYAKAIEPLEIAIERTKRKKVKNRYVYILAQLYQMQGNSELAMENFRKVLRLHPTYEMEFNARLNMAKNAADVKGSDKKVINPEMAIKRMIRDQKNEDYKDQLYFALAEIQLKSGNEDEGIAMLQKSLYEGSGGPQRAEACILLADIFFGREDYVKAYNYYDTTSTAMAKSDERMEYIMERKAQLKDISSSIQIIELKDSFLTVANLPYEGQKEWAQRMRKEEEAKKAANKNSNQRGGGRAGKNAALRAENISGGKSSASEVRKNQSNFELYNDNLRKKGEKEFNRRWGSRSWADNWRRSNVSDLESNEVVAEKSGELPPMTEKDVKDYLNKKKIPLGERSQADANDAIAAAFHKLGMSYHNDLNNTAKAAETFHELIDRYPDSKYELEALYMLYNIYEGQKNTTKQNQYKNTIIEKYPDSDIAKALQDPNFIGQKQQEAVALSNHYSKIQDMIKARKFVEARKEIQAVPTKFGKNYDMKPRFAILEAMCIGGIDGVDAYVKALKAVVAGFPKAPEKEQAVKMIEVLGGQSGQNTINTNIKSDGGKSVFDKNTATGHYMLIVPKDKKLKVSDYKGAVADFNKANFSLLRLNVSPLLLDRSVPALVVRKFRNGTEAQKYYTRAISDPNFLSAPGKFDVYFINQNNYRTILQKNLFKDYPDFFNQNLKD